MTEKQTLKATLVLELQDLAEAKEAYDFIINEDTNNEADPDIANTDARPDGVYLIYEDGSFELFKGDNPTDDIEYIGVKMGNHSLGVALHDLGKLDEDGDPEEFKLLADDANPPKDAPQYTRGRINAFEDFDGKTNTRRLKALNSPATKELSQGEWIPSLGELGIIMMNLTWVNKALDYAGGDQLRGWHWSSTEYSQNYEWYVSFSDGITNYSNKLNSIAVMGGGRILKSYLRAF